MDFMKVLGRTLKQGAANSNRGSTRNDNFSNHFDGEFMEIGKLLFIILI